MTWFSQEKEEINTSMQKKPSVKMKRSDTNKRSHNPGPQQSTAELGYLDSARVFVDRRNSEVGPELICSICQNVLWKPVACVTCENAFCGGCIRTWISKQKQSKQVTCPFNCKFQEKRAPPILNSFLSKLQIYCAYAPNGCEEVLSYDALEKHEQICECEKTRCKICQTPVSRRDPNIKHELRQCFLKMYDQDPDQIQSQFIQLLDVVESNQKRMADQDRRIQALETLLGIETQKPQ